MIIIDKYIKSISVKIRIIFTFIMLFNINYSICQDSAKDNISFYYNGGLNFSHKIIKDSYGLNNMNENPKLKYKLGTKQGLGVEYKILDKLYLLSGINYSRINLSEIYDDQFYQIELIENQDWISIPISCKIYFSILKIKPYIKAGFDFAYLLNISGELTRKYLDDPSVIYQETSIDSFNENRKKINLVFVSGIGLEYNFTNISLFLESNYEYGLFNYVNEENRFTDTELIFQYYYIDSDYKVQNFVILLGVRF